MQCAHKQKRRRSEHKGRIHGRQMRMLNRGEQTFAALLFQTTTLLNLPLLSRLRAIGVPMMPMPRNPTEIAAIVEGGCRNWERKTMANKQPAVETL